MNDMLFNIRLKQESKAHQHWRVKTVRLINTGALKQQGSSTLAR